MSTTKTFPCNTCELVFENSQAQRTHMREPWHVYNLRQRMAELSPISEASYADNVATNLVSSKPKSSKLVSSSTAINSSPEPEDTDEGDEVEDLISDETQIARCLFCHKDLDNLEANLDHMTSEHSLYIPGTDQLSSLETFLGYLRTVIVKYHECLYCGTVRQSADGIRRHMLDKGHCMINLEREPELLEFWDFSESDEHDTDEDETLKQRAQKSSAAASRESVDGEYTLPSGRVVGSKNKARDARRLARRLAAKEASSRFITNNAVDPATTTSSPAPAGPAGSLITVQETPQDRTHGNTQQHTLAKRDAVGLVGVSNQQIRSLVTVQRKMQRQQAMVRASMVWADEKGGTHQKHYKQKMNLRDG